MAGSLLLKLKNLEKQAYFRDLQNRLKRFISRHYASWFPDIVYHTIGKDVFLVEFRKGGDTQFYQDAKGNWVVFEGAVFALDKTKAYGPEEILRLYLEEGTAFAEKLDGHFVIKLFDARKKRHLIVNDIIKAKINYYAENEDVILFTPFALTGALIQPAEIDTDALNEILWRYYILSEKSIFKNVHQLRPASVYVIDKNEVTSERYWTFPDRLTECTYEESVEAFSESIRETARLLSGTYGKAGMDLTQGQDSRIIAAAFKQQNLPFSTTIFGQPEFSEVHNVGIMAKRHGIEHHTIGLSEDYIRHPLPYFKKGLLLGSGNEPGYLLGRILFMRDEQSRFGNVLLNGAGGPFYKDCFWEEIYLFNLYREPGRINKQQFLKLRPMNKNYPDTVFTDRFLSVKKNSERYFLDMLKSSVSGYEHLPVSMQIDTFSLTKWQNYAVISNSTAALLHQSISPLLLRRNLEIGINMPARWRWNKSKFQRDVMYRLDPALAREKTDFGGIDMVPKNAFTFIPFYLRYGYRQSSRFRDKIKNKLGMKVVTHLQAAWDYLPVYRNLMNSKEMQHPAQLDLLSGSDIIDQDAWRNYLQGIRENPAASQYEYEFMLKLIGLEALLALVTER